MGAGCWILDADLGLVNEPGTPVTVANKTLTGEKYMLEMRRKKCVGSNEIELSEI